MLCIEFSINVPQSIASNLSSQLNISYSKGRIPTSRNNLTSSFPSYQQNLSFGGKSIKGYSKLGTKKSNQDAYICDCIDEERNYRVFGVFDGHGEFGSQISQLTKSKLMDCLKKQLNFQSFKATLSGSGKPVMMNVFEGVQNKVKNEIIRKAFERMDKELDGVNFSTEKSGTTANVVLIGGKTLTGANVGDSRAVLASLNKSTKRWKSIPLSKDHKPTLTAERNRIENSGGGVGTHINASGDSVGPLRVYTNKYKTVGGLAMSRSIGDLAVKDGGVVSQPEIHEIILEDEDKFIIIATDGIWEVISNKEAINIVANSWLKNHSPQKAGEDLAKAAVVRWKSMDMNYIDDITVIVVMIE